MAQPDSPANQEAHWNKTSRLMWIHLGVWFFFQLWQGGWSLVQPQAGGGVAFFAHIGGFLFGLATVHLVKKRPPLRPAY